MNNINLNILTLKKKINNIINQNNINIKKIRILAVSKNQTVYHIKQAILSKQYHFGENYVQESLLKINQLKTYPKIIWHFIGKLQSNKTKIVAENFSWCQSIDREKIAILLNKYRPKNLSPINVLIQINISKENQKNGIQSENYHELAQTISLMPNIKLRGIMIMPSIKKDTVGNNIDYQTAQKIFNNLRKKYKSVDTFSLGTSIDIEKALISGSNMLRIGHYIFT